MAEPRNPLLFEDVANAGQERVCLITEITLRDLFAAAVAERAK